MTHLVQRLQRFGPTIFGEMSELAARTGAVNLGQGTPDGPSPREVLDAAAEAIAGGHNQYAPARGVPLLRERIAEHQQRFQGLDYDPDTEVLVTFGATEALAAAILALVEPGDEVVMLEPFYDAYEAAVALAGGVLVPVRLAAPDFRLDAEALRSAVTDRTRLLLINTPHNPTGRVLDRVELQAVADVAVEHDLLVVTDEVYEHLTLDSPHVSPATLPGMRGRTLRVSSAGKTFSVTGWKIGWVSAPADLVAAVATTKQFLTYSGGTPLQHGVAAGLALPDARFAAIRDDLAAGRDLLLPGLEQAGFDVAPTEGTYFVIADAAPLGVTDSIAFCRSLPERCGIAAVPSQVFYTDPTGVETLVRFAFCKPHEVIAEGARRLATLA